MLLFVELCVDLRKGKAAKDGLYQYKNIAQNTNVGTIEVRRICICWKSRWDSARMDTDGLFFS